MKQANHTWLEAVKYTRQNLTEADMEEMSALADSVPELETRCEEMEEVRDRLAETEGEGEDLRAFIEDCFARITGFAPYHESMEEIKAAILADIDQRGV